MDAEIVAVGSEMLTGDKVDTNSLYLTGQLNLLGVEVVQKAVVGDDRDRLTAVISDALRRSGIVILSGGLGPTEDDVTRDAVAAALGCGQSFRQEIADSIAARFARMGRTMAENNKRQAFVMDGAEVMPNDRGTAPGQWIAAGSKIVMLLPGPPKELKAMFEQQCLPRLRKILPAQFIRTVHMRVSGMGESDVDQLIAPVYTKYANPVTTILAGAGDIQLHLRARCDSAEEADALLKEVADQIVEVLGDRIYTRTGKLLEETVIEALMERNETASVAESCTGGLVAQRLTAIPGSSKVFAGGFITYTEAMKTQVLNVPAALIEKEGAVSEPVARAMAEGARERAGTSYALSVTGFAGPDGGTEENPVGTVYIGIAYPGGCDVRRVQYLGDRARVRMLASQTALDILRRKLRSQ
ncbi:MAG: competence/damage-inducible protein A [Bryobacteraceae bacterium]